jgi:hypothetical protein
MLVWDPISMEYGTFGHEIVGIHIALESLGMYGQSDA